MEGILIIITNQKIVYTPFWYDIIDESALFRYISAFWSMCFTSVNFDKENGLTMASGGSDESDFEGFTASDLEDFNDNRSEIDPGISVSPVSTPDISEAELSENESDDWGSNSKQEWTENLRAVKVVNIEGWFGS